MLCCVTETVSLVRISDSIFYFFVKSTGLHIMFIVSAILPLCVLVGEEEARRLKNNIHKRRPDKPW